MTVEAADKINFNRMIRNIEFLMEINHINDDELPEMPFNWHTYCPQVLNYTEDGLVHKTRKDWEGQKLYETFYIKSTLPRIGSYMCPNTSHLASIETYHLGNIRSPKVNKISIGFFERNAWTIQIEKFSTEFSIKDSTGKIYQLDISDEAAIFQNSMINPDTKDYLFGIAMNALHLLIISEHVDKVLLTSSGCVIDLEIMDLRKEFKIKE